MEIYIETFILQNILINFCLLKLVHITTKSRTTFFKTLIGSTLGTIPSIITFILLENNFILNLTKLTTAMLMIFISFKQSKKQFVFNLILLFLYTYAFGGLITSLCSSTYLTPFGAIIRSRFSLELITLVFIIFTHIFELVVKHLKLKLTTNNLIYEVFLFQKNKKIKVNAYLDTGNFLNHNGQPVLVLDLNTFLKLTNLNLINFLTTKTEEIKTETVTGNNNLKIFMIDKIKFKLNKKIHEFNNQYIAINTSNCFKNTNYQALLSPLFL